MEYHSPSVMSSMSKDEVLGVRKEGFWKGIETLHIVGENQP